MLRAFWRSGNFKNTRRWIRGRVLLTGGTGFLGVFLLRDLIQFTKVPRTHSLTLTATLISLFFKFNKSFRNGHALETSYAYFVTQVHIFCIVREQPGGVDAKERLKQGLQKFKILPLTSDRQQMTEEERYLDYGFEHRVTAVKGIL